MRRLLAAVVALAVAAAPASAANTGSRLKQAVSSLRLPAPAVGLMSRLQRVVGLSAPKRDAAQGISAQGALRSMAGGGQDSDTTALRDAAFDGAPVGGRVLGASVAVGATVLTGGAALAVAPLGPLAFEAGRHVDERRRGPPQPARDLGVYVQDAGSLVMTSVAIGFLMIAAMNLPSGGWLGGAAALLALFGAFGNEEMFAANRGRLQHVWQASHDQKYRHDYSTGQKRDIRGRKYGQGEDRYDKMIPGSLTSHERLLARAAGVFLGQLMLLASGAPLADYLVFNAGVSLAFAIASARSRPAAAAGPDGPPER